MSFTFSTPANPALGATSTPAKPAGFGNFSFGGSTFGTPATSAPPAFGASTPAFSTPNPAPKFGAPASAPAFGNTGTSFSGFGTATSTPAFGGFNSAATTLTSSFGSFGGIASASTAPSLGTSFTFSQPATTGTTNAFGFGNTNNFGFGTASTATPSFGLGTGTNTLGGGFGGGAFGSSFGKPIGSTFGFGQTTAQQQQQQQQQQPVLSSEEVLSQAIFNVNIFGDERDTTLAKWNYLQALLGTGKAYYSQTGQPVDINPQNYLCRFKTMGYNNLPGKDNKLGWVALRINKPISVVKDQQAQIQATINQVFGNKPNLLISIESMKALSDTKSQIIIYVDEKSPTSNETKRYSATETTGFLNQPMTRTQLNNIFVEEIIAMVLPDEDQLKQYLDITPKGIDPRMWKQAIADNPDPKKLIPVPLIGFNELKWRITCQENETNTHLSYLSNVEKEIADLKQRQSNTTAKITEHRRKCLELSHRILRIIVKQESTRKIGMALSPEEEIIKSKLENMQAIMSAPTQFKGKLSELLSQMRMQRNQLVTASTNEYKLDVESSEEMRNFLTMQQKAMELLIETVNKDLKDIKIISEGMEQSFGGTSKV